MKQYNGIDILKFFMALVVVMIHVKPNIHSNELSFLFKPLLMIAVPVFFVISSVFIFNKLKNGNDYALLNYCKRIGVLYLCWLIIDCWFIFTKKTYFIEGWGGLFDFLKDVFFATTFPGSWYLSASVIGVIFVYYMNKKINSYVIFLACLMLYYYVNGIDQFPEEYKMPYKWYATHFREEVRLSFPAQMIWISIGQLISGKFEWIQQQRRYVYPFSIVLALFSFFILLMNNSLILKVVVVIMFVVTGYLVQIPNKDIYKRIRNYSILIFFFHFSIAGKKNSFCDIVGDSLLTNWLYYFIVVFISITFAEIVLILEKKKYFSYLKYLH